MTKTLLWFCFFGLFSVIHGKLGFFNGYTRPLPGDEDPSEEDYRKIEELADYLRKRAQEAEAASLERYGSEDDFQYYPEGENPTPSYDSVNAGPQRLKDPEFAVGPSDPRYYQDFEDFTKNPASATKSLKSPKRKETKGSPEVVNFESSEPSHAAVYQSPMSEVIEAKDRSDLYFTAIVAGCSAAAVAAIVAIGISCYKLQKNAKAAADVDYPAYGVTGPHKDASPTSGDRRLAQSAQMYHYQHQKQQIIAMESRATNERRGSISDAESDGENEDGDYTVFECPGLASTGEMEVKNPLFQDDPTPATPVKGGATSKTPQEPPKSLILFD